MNVENFDRMAEKLRQRLVSPKKAAPYLEVSTQQLANWRWQGVGPPYFKEGESKRSKVWYDVNDLVKFKRSRLRRIVPNA